MHIRELLQQQQKFEALYFEKNLKSIQDNVANILGPVCIMWSMLEADRREMLQNDICLFDQTVLLVAQCFNEHFVSRRTNVLNRPMAN